MEQKKTIKKTSNKSTYNKSLKKTTTEKKASQKRKSKKQKKAFTLIELLAVIIILGVLMIIAIPSVTNYISDSRKSSYISTAKNIISGARNIVNSGKLEMYDTGTTYYIPYDMVNTENEAKSPYGDLIEGYVVVTFDSKDYDYYFTSIDESNTGIYLTYYDELDNDKIENDMEPISTDIAICGKENIILFDKSGNVLESKEADDCIDAHSVYDGNGEASQNIPSPSSFATDSWATISKAVKENNTSVYHVGDTKEVDLGDLGIHTVRIANMSTPSECSREGFSQTACGFVVEFADIVTNQRMNPNTQNGNVNGDGNRGGWEYSEMRKHVSTTIYNSLPRDLKKVIIDTFAVSSYGAKDSSNFETIDKLYLLSKVEVDGKVYNQYTDSAYSRQLDYYSSYNSNTRIALKNYGDRLGIWCLRSAAKMSSGPQYYNIFYGIRTSDGWVETYGACFGASPAFRIG